MALNIFSILVIKAITKTVYTEMKQEHTLSLQNILPLLASAFKLGYFQNHSSSIHVKTEQPEHDTLAGDDRAVFHHKTATVVGQTGWQAEANQEVHYHHQQTSQELHET